MDGTPMTPGRGDGSSGTALVSAIAALEPFFDPRSAWYGTQLEYFAFRTLREDHPELSTAEAYVLVLAAKRMYAMPPRHTG